MYRIDGRSSNPGGGKSALPVILGLRMIAAGLADRICWVVPRDSLKRQAAEAFTDPRWRSYLGHACDIREAGNEVDPCRGSHGYATTYQAIGADPDLHAREFRRHRTVLVLDELHHVAEGSLWHTALGPMVEQAALVVSMSGTLSRDDDRRIAFLRYVPGDDGRSDVLPHPAAVELVDARSHSTSCLRHSWTDNRQRVAWAFTGCVLINRISDDRLSTCNSVATERRPTGR